MPTLNHPFRTPDGPKKFAVYVNHSKTPNLRMKRSGAFETLRVIHKGEELFMDYDDSFGEEHIFDE